MILMMARHNHDRNQEYLTGTSGKRTMIEIPGNNGATLDKAPTTGQSTCLGKNRRKEGRARQRPGKQGSRDGKQRDQYGNQASTDRPADGSITVLSMAM